MSPPTLTLTERRIRLLETLERRIVRSSEAEHRLRRLRVLMMEAASRLRTGEAAEVVAVMLKQRGVRI